MCGVWVAGGSLPIENYCPYKVGIYIMFTNVRVVVDDVNTHIIQNTTIDCGVKDNGDLTTLHGLN